MHRHERPTKIETVDLVATLRDLAQPPKKPRQCPGCGRQYLPQPDDGHSCAHCQARVAPRCPRCQGQLCVHFAPLLCCQSCGPGQPRLDLAYDATLLLETLQNQRRNHTDAKRLADARTIERCLHRLRHLEKDALT